MRGKKGCQNYGLKRKKLFFSLLVAFFVPCTITNLLTSFVSYGSATAVTGGKKVGPARSAENSVIDEDSVFSNHLMTGLTGQTVPVPSGLVHGHFGFVHLKGLLASRARRLISDLLEHQLHFESLWELLVVLIFAGFVEIYLPYHCFLSIVDESDVYGEVEHHRLFQQRFFDGFVGKWWEKRETEKNTLLDLL